jgi:hypothetical protein
MKRGDLPDVIEWYKAIATDTGTVHNVATLQRYPQADLRDETACGVRLPGMKASRVSDDVVVTCRKCRMFRFANDLPL